jgi:hypothetical protein
MPDTTISYNWQRLPRVYLYFFGAFFIGLGVLAVWVPAAAHESSHWPTIIGYVFLICGFFMFVDQQTRIDTQSHLVFREGRLFGYLRLWFTRRSLGDFTAVTCRRVEHIRSNDSVFIGLRRQTGRVMELCYFTVATGYPCEQARREAQLLAQRLGLPLDEHVA